MTIQDLLKSSFRKLGIVASGEEPTPAELADALTDLNSMLKSWATMKINVNATVPEIFTITAGQNTYTWGATGNINTTRPSEIVNMFIRESQGIDTDVDPFSKGQYNSITTKDISGKPFRYYYNPMYPLGYLYLYPTPDISYELHIDSIKTLASITDYAAELNMPDDYLEVITYNLAVRIAPDYGKTIPQEIAAIASSSYDRMINLNAQNQLEPQRLDLPLQRQFYNYNIRQG